MYNCVVYIDTDMDFHVKGPGGLRTEESFKYEFSAEDEPTLRKDVVYWLLGLTAVDRWDSNTVSHWDIEFGESLYKAAKDIVNGERFTHWGGNRVVDVTIQEVQTSSHKKSK